MSEHKAFSPPFALDQAPVFVDFVKCVLVDRAQWRASWLGGKADVTGHSLTVYDCTDDDVARS